MSLPPTTNLGLVLPVPDVDAGWGYTVNSAFVSIDNIFAADGTGSAVGANVGSGKTLTLGGTMIIGGSDNTATPTAATIRGAKVAAGTTDTKGPDLTISASNGTGTGGSGAIIFRTAPPAASSGSTVNTLATALYIKNDASLGVGTADPQGIIDVKGTTSTTPVNWAYLRGGNVSSSVPTFGVSFSSGNGIAIGHNYAGNREADIVWDQTQNSNQYMAIYKSDGTTVTEQLRLNSSGAIGLAGNNFGTAGQVLTSGGSSAVPTWTTISPLTKLASQATTSGTSVEFTGISSAAMVQIIFDGVQISAGDTLLIQLGGTSYKTSGYDTVNTPTYTTTYATPTNGFGVYLGSSSAKVSGTITLAGQSTNNDWSCSYSMADSGTPRMVSGGGTASLGSALTKLKIIFDRTANFTAGNIRVVYFS